MSSCMARFECFVFRVQSRVIGTLRGVGGGGVGGLNGHNKAVIRPI